MIKKLFKWLIRILGALLGLAIIAYVILLLINWNDRPPSETAQAFSDAINNLPEVADEDNAYVLIKEISDSHLQQYPTGSEFAASVAEDCQNSAQIAGCLDAVAVQNYGAKLWLQEQQWILDKYIEIITRSNYLEPIPEDPLNSPLLSFGDVSYGHRLLMVSAMLSAADGDKAHVIALLEADLHFWRLLLASSDLLYTKSIAAAFVRNHFIEGNRVLLELHRKNRLHTLPLNWLKEINSEEQSMRRTLIGEWQFITNSLRSPMSNQFYVHDPTARRLAKVSDWLNWQLLTPLLQPQDTSNNFAAMFKTTIELLDVPLDEFSAALKQSETLNFQYPAGIRRLYNPAASIHIPLINVSGDFFARSTDLEGIRRAAVVTNQLREQQVPMDQIADSLATSPYNNPYNDESFEWDTESGEIIFRGLGDRFDGVYRFRY